MGFFTWFGSLIDQFLDWLGEIFRRFIEALVYALQKIWNTRTVLRCWRHDRCLSAHGHSPQCHT